MASIDIKTSSAKAVIAHCCAQEYPDGAMLGVIRELVAERDRLAAAPEPGDDANTVYRVDGSGDDIYLEVERETGRDWRDTVEVVAVSTGTGWLSTDFFAQHVVDQWRDQIIERIEIDEDLERTRWTRPLWTQFKPAAVPA